MERNAPDATFGWGVVFSEETLGALRDADYATYLEITDSFARWTSIDIHYRGRVLRSSGHTFSAIKRTHLLDILQRRARALGVDRWSSAPRCRAPNRRTWSSPPTGRTARCAGRADFGTTVEPQGCKYVWFGTDLVFDAFTFIFKETEHGLFQVHAYPFDEYTSTFIVETRPDDLAARRARHDVGAGQHRVLPGAVRRGARRAPADVEQVDLARLPLGAQRFLACPDRRRQRRADRRLGAHRALLHRLGHQARDGGRDRAGQQLRAAPARASRRR